MAPRPPARRARASSTPARPTCWPATSARTSGRVEGLLGALERRLRRGGARVAPTTWRPTSARPATSRATSSPTPSTRGTRDGRWSCCTGCSTRGGLAPMQVWRPCTATSPTCSPSTATTSPASATRPPCSAPRRSWPRRRSSSRGVSGAPRSPRPITLIAAADLDVRGVSGLDPELVRRDPGGPAGPPDPARPRRRAAGRPRAHAR